MMMGSSGVHCRSRSARAVRVAQWTRQALHRSDHSPRNFTESIFGKKFLDKRKEDVILFVDMVHKQCYHALGNSRQVLCCSTTGAVLLDPMHRAAQPRKFSL